MQRANVNAKGYSLRQFTAGEVIAAARNEQWDLFLDNGSKFSNWNLHMNLAYAYSSLSVKSLVEEAYNRVFENDDAPFVLEDEDDVQSMMNEFDENMQGFCEIEIKGKTVSELLDDNLHNHVRKSRGSFDKSVYADRILLIYSLVWEISRNNEDAIVCEKVAKYLFEKVLKDGEFTKITVESSGKVKLQTYLEMFDDYRKTLFGDDLSRAKKRQKRPMSKPQEQTKKREHGCVDDVDEPASKRPNTHVEALSPLATPNHEVVSFNEASPTDTAGSLDGNTVPSFDLSDETVEEAPLLTPEAMLHGRTLPSKNLEKSCFDNN